MSNGGYDRDQVQDVVLKVLGVALGIGLVIGLGTWVLVKGLGLDSADEGSAGVAQAGPVTPLPSSALPVPTDTTPPPPDGASIAPTPTAPGTGLYLTASPVIVKPMERINLTGQWPGQDNTSVAVQRLENGKWVDFGVQAQVRVGTFETYVMTGRSGDQRFRVVGPGSDAVSNEVTITVQ